MNHSDYAVEIDFSVYRIKMRSCVLVKATGKDHAVIAAYTDLRMAVTSISVPDITRVEVREPTVEEYKTLDHKRK